MFTYLPGEAVAGAFEMVCCFFTVVVAFIGYLFTLRF